jgi:spore germination cell wall hydrolase CwlJ-like protein
MFLSGGVAAASTDNSNSNATQSFGQSDLETIAVFAKSSVNSKELQCLARNIYHESGSEPNQGKIAVGMVTLNRADHPDYPDSVCDVVKQKTSVRGRLVCQFSWVCNKRKTVNETSDNWQHSLSVARYLLDGGYEKQKSVYGRLLYFHATHINPGWSNLKRMLRIGDHVFYAERRT